MGTYMWISKFSKLGPRQAKKITGRTESDAWDADNRIFLMRDETLTGVYQEYGHYLGAKLASALTSVMMSEETLNYDKIRKEAKIPGDFDCHSRTTAQNGDEVLVFSNGGAKQGIRVKIKNEARGSYYYSKPIVCHACIEKPLWQGSKAWELHEFITDMFWKEYDIRGDADYGYVVLSQKIIDELVDMKIFRENRTRCGNGEAIVYHWG